MKIASWRSWPVLAPFFWLLAASGRRLPGQGAAGCLKETSEIDFGTLLASPNADLGTIFFASRALGFRGMFLYFRAAAALNFLSFAVCVKNARIAYDPQKPNVCS